MLNWRRGIPKGMVLLGVVVVGGNLFAMDGARSCKDTNENLDQNIIIGQNDDVLQKIDGAVYTSFRSLKAKIDDFCGDFINKEPTCEKVFNRLKDIYPSCRDLQEMSLSEEELLSVESFFSALCYLYGEYAISEDNYVHQEECKDDLDVLIKTLNLVGGFLKRKGIIL